MEAPKEFYEKMGPKVEAHIQKSNPEMPETERKAKAQEFLKVSWGRFSPEKQAEFTPKGPKVDNDRLFADIFGDGKASAPATGGLDLDLDGILDGLMDVL
jgi:hypothetical protein